MTLKNYSGFNKDGSNTKRKFRLYCDTEGCEKFIIVQWEGGYGSVKDNDGN